jgi:putative transposase
VRDYPNRLHHETPAWAGDGALFHIRIRAEPTQHPPLSSRPLAPQLLTAARRYHELSHWWCELFLLMPDHVHAIVAFPPDTPMTATLRNWKRGTTRFQHVEWQEGFFDHRLRATRDASEKWNYIRHNPVAKSLCAHDEEWPWWWSAVLPNPLYESGAA